MKTKLFIVCMLLLVVLASAVLAKPIYVKYRGLVETDKGDFMSTYGLHLSSDDLFNYTDDLLVIHKQLTGYMLDNDTPIGAQVLIADTVMQTLFDEGLLELSIPLRPKEKKSKYAREYVDVINEAYHSAHRRVIKAFHDCWGVLPSKELDDYRGLGITPLSLSQDFIAEALASEKATMEPVKVTLTTEQYQVHPAAVGEDKKPVYVRTAEGFARDRAYWFLSNPDVDGISADYVDGRFCFDVDRATSKSFVHDGKVYISVADTVLEGTGWVPCIEWYTDEELSELFEESKNDA